MAKEIIITDVQKLQRELMKIEPDLKKRLVRDIKQVAEPVKNKVKSAVPVVSPLQRGMGESRGRLGWNHASGKKPNDVRIVYRSGSKKKAGMITSLVSVNVGSAAATMVDMAGKRNPNGRNARGAVFIRNLNQKGFGKPSRYAWPAAEEALPAAAGKIKNIIDGYCREWNIKA
jgi:hypothetical protein